LGPQRAGRAREPAIVHLSAQRCASPKFSPVQSGAVGFPDHQPRRPLDGAGQGEGVRLNTKRRAARRRKSAVYGLRSSRFSIKAIRGTVSCRTRIDATTQAPSISFHCRGWRGRSGTPRVCYICAVAIAPVKSADHQHVEAITATGENPSPDAERPEKCPRC